MRAFAVLFHRSRASFLHKQTRELTQIVLGNSKLKCLKEVNILALTPKITNKYINYMKEKRNRL